MQVDMLTHKQPKGGGKSKNNDKGQKSSKGRSKCYQCGSFGHMVWTCPEKGQVARCFECGKRGHQSNYCWSKDPQDDPKGKGKSKDKTKSKSKKVQELEHDPNYDLMMIKTEDGFLY